MAATLCNLSSGSGLMQLNHHLQNKQSITRCYSLAPLLVTAKRASCCCISSQRCSDKTCGRQIRVKGRHHWWRTSSNSRAEHSDTVYKEEEQEDISRQTLIWRAIKLPIYSVALIPLTVGSAAAYFLTGLFSTRRYLVLLASSVLIITWLNLR